MVGAGPSVYDGCRNRLGDLLDAGERDLGVLERAIETYALGHDDKDALWLWAVARRGGHDHHERVAIAGRRFER